MTQAQIDAQIAAIHKATEMALRSKESALQFLIDAGIVKDEKKLAKPKKQTSK